MPLEREISRKRSWMFLEACENHWRTDYVMIMSCYCHAKSSLVGGWPTPLNNDGVQVSWDDELPNWMESHKIPWFQTTNQILCPINTYCNYPSSFLEFHVKSDIQVIPSRFHRSKGRFPTTQRDESKKRGKEGCIWSFIKIPEPYSAVTNKLD